MTGTLSLLTRNALRGQPKQSQGGERAILPYTECGTHGGLGFVGTMAMGRRG